MASKALIMKKVYVTYDPLLEKIICVHDEPEKMCKDCINANKDKDGYVRGTYQLEENEFVIKTGKQLKSPE